MQPTFWAWAALEGEYFTEVFSLLTPKRSKHFSVCPPHTLLLTRAELRTDLPRACLGPLSDVARHAPAWQQVFHQHFRAQHSWRPSFLYHGLLVWSMVWRLRVCSQRPVKRAGRSTKDDEQVLTASVHKCCMESALAPPEGSCAARHAPSSRQESQSGAAHFLGVGSSCAGYTQR